jgi:hypothetical protein
MSTKIWTDLDFISVSKVINLPNPTAASDAATKAYVDSVIEGLGWKESVVVASTGNINLASPGASIDGITLVTGDRVLVKDQTSVPTNGIYTFATSSTPMVRAADANTFLELEAAVVTVEEGTSGGSAFRQTAVNGTLGSTNIVWTAFGTVAPAATTTTAGIVIRATQLEVDTGTDTAKYVTPATLVGYANRTRKFTQLIGDGSATSFVITHNFNTREVLVDVFYESGNYDTIIVDITRTSVNAVTIVFSNAPTSNQFRVVILG